MKDFTPKDLWPHEREPQHKPRRKPKHDPKAKPQVRCARCPRPTDPKERRFLQIGGRKGPWLGVCVTCYDREMRTQAALAEQEALRKLEMEAGQMEQAVAEYGDAVEQLEEAVKWEVGAKAEGAGLGESGAGEVVEREEVVDQEESRDGGL